MTGNILTQGQKDFAGARDQVLIIREAIGDPGLWELSESMLTELTSGMNSGYWPEDAARIRRYHSEMRKLSKRVETALSELGKFTINL